MADAELKKLQSFLLAYYPLCLEDYNRFRPFFDTPTSPAANGPLVTQVSLEEVKTSDSDSNSDGEFTKVILKKILKKIQQGTASASFCSPPSPAETKPPPPAAEQTCDSAPPSPGRLQESLKASPAPASDESMDVTHSAGSCSPPSPAETKPAPPAAEQTCDSAPPSPRRLQESPKASPAAASDESTDVTHSAGPSILPPPAKLSQATCPAHAAKETGRTVVPSTSRPADRSHVVMNVNNTSDHRPLTAFLQERGIDNHSDPLDDELRAFVRIAKEISTEDIKADLVRQGIPVLQVRRMSNRRTKAKYKVVMCVLPRTKKGKAIFRIRRLCGLTDISVEHPRQQVANNKKTHELGAAKKKTAKPQKGPSSLKPSVGCLELTPAVQASAPAQAPYTSWPCIPKQEPDTSSSLVYYHLFGFLGAVIQSAVRH